MAIQSLNENGQLIARESFGTVVPQKPRKSPTGIVIFCIFVLAVAGGMLYWVFAPQPCPALYRAAEESISAPAAAEIRFIAPNGPVRKGEILARLLIQPDSGGAFLEQTHLLRDRLLRLEEEEHARQSNIDSLTRNLESLHAELPVAEADAELAAYAKRNCDAIERAQQKQYDTAARLFELESIRNSELTFAREELERAKNEAGKAALQLKKATLQAAALQNRIAAETKNLQRLTAVAAARKTGGDAFRRRLEEQLARMEFVPGGVLLTLPAANDGTFSAGGVRAGNRIAAGDILGRVYRDEPGTLAVYVPAAQAAEITEKTQFQLSIGGRRFQASPKLLSPTLELLPNPLKGMEPERKQNELYRRAELLLPGHQAPFLNGQTGTAIIR